LRPEAMRTVFFLALEAVAIMCLVFRVEESLAV